MSTVKPICVTYIPTGLSLANGRVLSWDNCHEIGEGFEKKMPDYYHLVLLNSEIENVDIKVFYEKDFTPIQYEELKELIKKSIEK